MARRRVEFGSIRKLPSGRYQPRFLDKEGQYRSTGNTHETWRDAARELAQVQVDLTRGTWIDPRRGSIPLREYKDSWLPQRRVKGRPLAPRTLALYSWLLDKHVLPHLGDYALKDIDARTVRAWHAALTSPQGPGAVTVAKAYRLLRAIMNTALADELIVRSPCTLPGAGEEPTAERPAISVPEVYALADAVGARWRALVLLAAFCGLRFGELAALKQAQLDLLHGEVAVVASASEAAGVGRTPGPTKTRSTRVVAIPPHVIPDLRCHVDEYSTPGPEGLVFIGPRGGALRCSNFGTHVWRPAVRSCGLEGVHFHDLRGTAATLAAIAGATTAELLARMGHARLEVALRYQRATADRDAALAAALSAYVSPTVLALPNARAQ